MTEPQPVIKQRVYPSLDTIATPDNLDKMKKCMKSLHKIAIAIEDKEIELYDIVCQNAEEYNVLCEYRRRINQYKKQLSQKAMKKLFH